MLAEHHGFLWIKGKPGAGKSTLMKCAVKHVEHAFSDDLEIDFFFNAKGAPLERSIEGMYRSLLYQLPTERPQLRRFFKSRVWTQQPWPLELLKETLRDVVLCLHSERLTCHIDALDECDESDVRDMVSSFEELGATAVASNVHFRVCFASRHYPRISISKCVTVVLDELESHQQDIESYVRNALKVSSPEIRDELAHEVRRRARDVFLWVVLVVSLLNKESDRGNDHKLRMCLGQIPDGVGGLIEDAILARGKDERACANTPLDPIRTSTSDTVRAGHAVLHTNDDLNAQTPISPKPNRNQIDAFILNASKGLAEIVPTDEIFRDRVQFIHETVREYLIEGGMRRLHVSFGSNLEGMCHDILGRTCVNYMSIAASDLPPAGMLGRCLPGFRTRRSERLKAHPFVDVRAYQCRSSC